MSKYLVTGGAGFIGSHIVEKLLADKHCVVVLDNFSSGKEENLLFAQNISDKSKYMLIRGDVCDYSVCLEACRGVDYVLHQAALRSVPKSMNNPYEYNEVNIDGTLNILKASKECKVKRVVFASSSSIYGETKKFPEKEQDYPLLIAPYALTKLAGEFYCRIFSHNFGLETVCLRYFNVYGPRQSLDDEYAVVIPKFINCILNGEQPPVYGTGRQSRDFTFVQDAVWANILAATAPGISGEIFNIADGKSHLIIEIVDILNTIAGTSVAPLFLPIRPGDVFKTEADISKANSLLKYKPNFGFRQGLEKTFAWFKSQKNV